MIKLIKMNLYRVFHSKSTWIMLLVVIGFALFSGYMEKEDFNMQKEAYEKGEYQESEEEEEQVEMGISVSTPFNEKWVDGSKVRVLEFICADISSGIMLIMVTIFAVLFVHAEDSSGFVKNIAGQVKRRWMLYLSKTIIVMAFTFFSLLLYSFIQGIVLMATLDNVALGTEIFGDTVKFVLAQWFMYSAFASGLILAVTVIRSTAISITWGELSALGFGSIIAGFINKLIDNKDFNISDYFLTDNIKALSWDSAQSDFIDALVLALIFFAVYNLIGMIWVNKRDVNV